ncbi:MAG: hypothetical protein R2818_11650 [Flavobacteriales bacterium]
MLRSDARPLLPEPNVCDEDRRNGVRRFHPLQGELQLLRGEGALADEVRDATQQHLKGLMKSELEWVRKMPRARGTKSKSRLDAFETIEADATRNFEREQAKIDVKTERLGGKVMARNLTKSFGDPSIKPHKPIVAHFSYSLKRGDRIGIVGPNGISKSTSTCSREGGAGHGHGEHRRHGDPRHLRSARRTVEKADQRIIEVVRDIAELIT